MSVSEREEVPTPGNPGAVRHPAYTLVLRSCMSFFESVGNSTVLLATGDPVTLRAVVLLTGLMVLVERVVMRGHA